MSRSSCGHSGLWLMISWENKIFRWRYLWCGILMILFLACPYYMENNKVFMLINDGVTSFFFIAISSSYWQITSIKITSLLVELKWMLHYCYNWVKNCMTWCRSMMTLCLIFNLVGRSLLVLVWPIIWYSKVFFESFLIERWICTAINLMSCILKKICLKIFLT